MTTKAFDPTKPVQTRDGFPARIICTDLRDNTPFNLVALTSLLQTGQESVFYYTPLGRFRADGSDHPYDLVNVPVRTSTWENVYKVTSGGSVYHDKETASLSSSNSCKRWGPRIGYLRRDFEDGVLVSAEFEPLTGERSDKDE